MAPGFEIPFVPLRMLLGNEYRYRVHGKWVGGKLYKAERQCGLQGRASFPEERC